LATSARSADAHSERKGKKIVQVFKQLFKKKQARLGIDISSTAVKVIQLDRVRNGYRVVAYAIEPLPPGSVQDKNIADQEAVAAAIVRALGKARTKLRHAVLAVPGSATVSRVVSVPGSLKEFELEETIKLEANSFIPYPIDEVSLDFEVIGKPPLIPTTSTCLLSPRVVKMSILGLPCANSPA